MMMRTIAIAISLGFLVSAGAVNVRAATDPADACTDAKAKAAGKKASGLLKAYGKNIKKSNPAKLAQDVSKAQSKLTKAFVKAESKGGCATIGDVGAMEAKVDALVADAIDEINPICNCGPETPVAAAFLTVDGGGTCGSLRRFSCQDPGGVPSFLNHACATNADCDLGPCVASQCTGDAAIGCSGNMDCQSTCAEVVGLGLPLNFECGGLYTGGGGNTVPLPLQGLDMNAAIAQVTSCVSNVLTLGPTTPAQVGNLHCTQGRQCSGSGAPCVLDSDCPALETCDDLCEFGAPLPVPNTTTPPVSVCSVNVVAEDTSGDLNCDDGSGTTTTNLRAVIHLTGDLLKSSTPPDVPGVQPCPLCTTVCVGGTDAGFPCVDDSECNLGDCGSSGDRCVAGPNDGDPCTPGTSRLDVHDCCVGGTNNSRRCNPGVNCALGGGVCTPGCTSFPTSHDCPPDPLQDITFSIGGLPISFSTTTGTETLNAKDQLSPQALRVFCGFCRDTLNGGSGCFEGDFDGSCPAAIPAADGNGVPCDSNADCADGDSYETCSQRTPGAFSRAAATTMTIAGSTDGQSLGDFDCHDTTLASIFCIPPTFDPSVDAAGDLPGAGATTLIGLRRVAADVNDFFPIDPDFCPGP
jgi:hypothetical protein